MAKVRCLTAVCAAVLHTVVGLVFADPSPRNQDRWGVAVGVNLSFFDYKSPTPYWEPQNNVGFSLGVLRGIGLNQRLSFLSSMSYVKLNSHIDMHPAQGVNFSFPGGALSTSLDYIVWSAALKGYFAEGLPLYGVVGPQIGFLWGANRTVTEVQSTGSGVIELQKLTTDTSDQTTRFNATVALGVGADLYTVSGSIVYFEIGYAHGLTTSNTLGATWNTGAVAFAVGWLH
jgi:hypothetical protein